MVKLKCDFCGKELEFENMKDVLQIGLDEETNYYIVCTKCTEKIDNLISNNYQVVQIATAD